MKQMDPAALSGEYAVRRLDETDIPAVLALMQGNPQSTRFWKKNGFRVIREIPQKKGTILLAERELS